MGADRNQWQFPKNVGGNLIGWRDDGKGLENKAPGVGFATAAQGALADGAAQKAQNLADLTDKGEAQDNLQVGVTFTSRQNAIDANIKARNKRIRTQFHTPNYAVPATLIGGAHYRRVSFADLGGVPSQAYFRSADRFMPDGTTDATNGGYWVLDESEVDWRMLGVKADTSDDTLAAQAAIDFCMLDTNRTLKMTGTVSASKLIFSGATSARVIFDNCFLVANSDDAQTCLLEIKVSNFLTEGRLVAIVGYRTNYECAVWYWHETAAQYSVLRNVIPNSAKIGFRIGNIAFPGALISEVVLENAQSYACPVAMEVVGGETYIDVSSPQLWASGVGGDAGWLALENIAIRNIGASVNVSGGECIIPGSTNGVVHEMQPIDRGGGRVEWGSSVFDTVFVETASPLSRTANPGALTINNSVSNRRGMIQFNNCVGFHSQDITAFIYADPTYDDHLIVSNPGFWYPGGTRTQPSIYCEVGSTAEVTVTGDWGPGFLKDLSGIANGRLNFSRRTILIASSLNGQDFAVGVPETCLFSQVNSYGDRARFQTAYSAGTGIFTVPDGGLDDVTASFVFRALSAGITGTIALFLDNVEVASVSIVSSRASLTYDLGALNSGQNLRVVVQDVSSNTFAHATADFNRFSVTARRGYL